MIDCAVRAFRTSHFAWVMVAFVSAALFLSFRTGVVHGFDHTISDGAYARIIFGIGAVISENKGDGRGYVISQTVRDALIKGGLTDDPAILRSLGTRFPENFANAGLIDHAIDAALSSKVDHAIMPSSHDDIGFVDFIKLSFDLFGSRVIAFYLTYFLVSAAAIVTFLIAFRDRPVNLTMLGIVAAAELLLFVSDFYNEIGHSIGSVTDVRYMSVLAAVPGLYIGLLACDAQPLSWSRGIGLAIQATILVFVYSIRASVIWIVVAIATVIGAALLFSLVHSKWARISTSAVAGITIVLAFASVYTTRAPGIWGMIAVAVLMGGVTLAAQMGRKPAIVVNSLSAGFILALSFAGHGVFVGSGLNPVYKAMGVMTSHPLWHSAILSLTNCPDWQRKYGPVYRAQFDDLPPAVVNKYLENHPAPSNFIFHGGSYNGTPLTDFGYETYTRLAFLDLLEHDPKFVISCNMVYRPMIFALGLVAHLKTLWQPFEPAFWLAIVGLLVMGVYFAGASASYQRAMTLGAIMVVLCFFLASAPNIAVDVNPYNMIDATLMLICSIEIFAVLLVGWIGRFCLRLWRSDRLQLIASHEVGDMR